MVTHVTYQEEHFTSADACLDAIREYLDLGWQVSQVRGAGHGPFVVLFRFGEAV